MKEADKIPLEMPLGALKSYALNIKEAAANPGKSENDDKGASNRKTETAISRKKGGNGNEKIKKAKK
jgi:hypothetical protein